MDTTSQSLEPLAYHSALRDYLKTHEAELWNWFASAQAQADYTEHLRLELLKTAYRLDAGSHGDLFRAAEEAKERLRLDLPLTLYQLQNSSHLNAALYYIPGEGHVVFSGPVLSLLNTEEIKSLLRAAADRERRSITSMVEVLVMNHARKSGVLPRPLSPLPVATKARR